MSTHEPKREKMFNFNSALIIGLGGWMLFEVHSIDVKMASVESAVTSGIEKDAAMKQDIRDLDGRVRAMELRMTRP